MLEKKTGQEVLHFPDEMGDEGSGSASHLEMAPATLAHEEFARKWLDLPDLLLRVEGRS